MSAPTRDLSTTQNAPERPPTINDRLLAAAERHLTTVRLEGERQRREAISYWQMCMAAVEHEKV